MRRSIQVIVGLGIVAAGWAVWSRLAERAERRESYDAAIMQGADLERVDQAARAALVYEQALDWELTADQTRELKFRRARSLIQANDLNGALGIIQDLLNAEPQGGTIDLGPLLLQLGRRAKERGDAPMAKLAFRLGQASFPQRYEEFGRELEAFIRPVPQDGGGPSK